MTAPRTTWSAKLHRQIQSKLRLKTARRRNVRIALLASNVLILAVIIAFVVQKPSVGTTAPVKSSAAAATAANPLDQVSSADIALTVARMNSLPETTAINNQAQSQAAEVAIAASSNNVTSKPAVIATSLKSSADIKDYTVLPGDTVASIAAKFGVTSESIRWSNNLTGDAVSAGTTIAIPPVNGIVYTVNNGDTADSLAAKFHASKDKIIAYNDAEIKGFTVGQRIIIPDAVQGSTNLRSATIGPSASAFAWGTSPMYGANGYDYGYCTWYVANRIAVPNNWGNANTWSYYAPGSGWTVSKRPVKGSIAQTTGPGYGHVALVEDVSDDGLMIKYSDMNGLAGWGRVGLTNNWVPASKFNNYIYR